MTHIRRGAIALALLLAGVTAAIGQTSPGTSPLSIIKGGTGGITPAAARINLGFAATANRLYGTDGSGVSTVVTMPAAGLTLSGGAISFANDLAALEGLSSTGIARRTGTDAWSLGTAVSNAEHATMPAYTFKGNNTSGSATPTDVDIAALTTKASPAAGDYVILSDQAASGAWKKATVSSVGSAGSVSSIAGNTGAFTLGLGLTNSGNDIRMASGAIIGSVSGSYVTNTSLSATIPADDSIPQISEGTQIISVSYTPRSSSSTLRCRFSGQVSADANDNVIGAMFATSFHATNAFASQMVIINSSNTREAMAFEGEYAPGTVSAQTITFRIGAAGSNSALNGTPGSRILGGSSVARMVCQEIAP